MNELAEKKYSLVIIGGGIVGLSAAIAWAKNRDTAHYPVLLLEKQPVVGGMVTSFKRKGYLFDTSQIIPDSTDILRYFGIDFELKKFSGSYARIVIVNEREITKIDIPSGYEEFRDMLVRRYPREKRKLLRFFNYSMALFGELKHLKLEPGVFDLINTVIRCPKIVRHRNKTFHEYFDSFGFSDPELKEIFDIFAAFSGLPGERAAALMTIGAMNTSLAGSYRPKKGFIHLPQALRKRAEELGCDIKTRCEVTKIITEKGKVTGVLLNDGTTISADTVISAVDTKVAMEKLIGLNIIGQIDPAYAAKAENVSMSPSSFNISLGLDDGINLEELKLDCGYNVITTGKGTFEKCFKAYDKGTYILDENSFHTAAICPSLTTGGKPAITIRVVPMPMGNWKQLRDSDYATYMKKKEEVAYFYIRQVEKYLIPGLSDHIVIKDIASPATFERYSGSPTGSNYDMSPYPENFGMKRLKMRTPIKGLFHPKFAHGIWPSFQAGLQVVDMILGGEIMGGYSRYRERK